MKRGYLGVGLQPVPLPAQIQQALGREQATGLLVLGVEPSSPAEAAGLILGDILVGVGGSVIADMDDLQAELGGERVGQSALFQVVRGGQPQTMNVVVGERQ